MRVEEARADYLATLVDQQGWPEMTIEEIADVNPRVDKGSIPDDLPVSFVPMPAVGAGDGSIHVEETRPAGEVKKGFTAFLEGDVLFAKITPCMENGKMAVVPKLVNGFGFGSTEFHVLRPKPGIDAKYLYYYVSSPAFRGEAERHMTGAVGQRRVPTAYLKECNIPIAPLDQQERIVAEIEKQFSRLDEAVANLKRVKANLKRYKAAVLKAAVEGRLVETEAELARREGRSYETGEQLLQRILETRRSQWQGKGKYKEPAAPDTTDLPELPAGWCWMALSQLAVLENGDRSKNYPSRSAFVEQGIPFINAGHLDDGRIDMSEMNFISEDRYSQLRAGKVRENDLLFCLRGSLGKAAIVRSRRQGAIASSLVIVRTCEHVEPDYLLLYLMSTLANEQIQLYDNGSAQPNLSAADLGKFVVPIPPVVDQQRIATEVDRHLSLLRKTEAQVDANVQRATRLRQAIMNSAFQGK